MCNAGEHSHTRHLTCENGQPSRHTPALPHFSNLPSKTAHVFPSRRNWCAGLHRHTSPWLSRHALADHALAPCHTQGVEKCESPRLGSATRAALAHAVPSRTTPVRLFASPHLALPLPRPCTCAVPHQGVETCEGPRTGSATRAALAHAVPMTAVRNPSTVSRQSKIGRVDRPHQRVCKHLSDRIPKVGK